MNALEHDRGELLGRVGWRKIRPAGRRAPGTWLAIMERRVDNSFGANRNRPSQRPGSNARPQRRSRMIQTP